MTWPGQTEFAFCPELVVDDYGREVPCRQVAEVVRRYTLAGTGTVTHVQLVCLVRHVTTPVDVTVTFMQ